MEERTKLGRGLEEVSQFYLSGRTGDKPRLQEIVKEDPACGNIVRVFHPGSCLVQSFFLANLALELARNRFSVLVWDCMDKNDENIESLMRTLITQYGDSDTSSKVSLYGLPDIVIYKESLLNTRMFSDLAGSIHSGNDNRYLLVNMNASLESIKDHDFHADSIFLSHPNEKDLLMCYACIKVLSKNGFAGDISIVFDDFEQGQNAQSLFSRFAAFVEKKLSLRLEFIGTLSHDKYFHQSTHDGKPLMLLQEQSKTKEDMTSISKTFLQNRQLHSGDQV